MKPFLRTAAICFVAVLVLGWIGTVGAEAAPVDSTALARQVLTLVNQERANAGLLPLQWNDILASAATAYAQEMATKGFFAHNSPDGTTPVERARRAGYEAYGWGGLYVGENLARGFSSAEGAMQGWMASEGHRKNVLLDKYRETGIGVVVAANGVVYWAEEFGSRPKVLPVFINRDAAATDSCDVILSICSETVSNWGSIGEITGMMVSNRPDFAGAVWEPYSKSKAWTLRGDAGAERVYVRLRDKNGAVVESWDEIQLLGQAALSLAPDGPAEPLAAGQDSPVFRLGFERLASLIPEWVGEPVENEYWTDNGDSIQRTTTGLMQWRGADNSVAFTNGSRSWIYGPYGLQERGNQEKFAWEK